MKTKSNHFPSVTYERWKTPVMNNPSMSLNVKCVLQAGNQVHFFLCYRETEEKEIHTLSIPRGYPYRVFDEGLGYSGVCKHLNEIPREKKSRYKVCSTWKFWNTDFIKELDGGEEGRGELSGFGQINRNKIIHYLVFTGGGVIEFISPAMRWELHKNIKIEKLLELYAKKRFYERYDD